MEFKEGLHYTTLHYITLHRAEPITLHDTLTTLRNTFTTLHFLPQAMLHRQSGQIPPLEMPAEEENEREDINKVINMGSF